jgi:dUTP pyrophosphatase
MKIQVLKNENYDDEGSLPKRATDRSTGYDIICNEEPEIVGEKNENGSYKRIDFIQYKTNLKLAVQKEKKSWSGIGVELIDYDVLAFPRSSISKYNLLLSNCIGLIDADYRGEVLLRFKYIWQPEDYKIGTDNLLEGNVNLDKIYKKGDKVCQLKVTKIENIEFVLVNELDSTNRGEGGFGSTDVKKSEKSDVAVKQMSTMEQLYTNLGGVSTPSKTYIQLVRERDSKQFNQ